MRRNPRRERPERAASSQPRALPWAGDLLGFQPAQGRRKGFLRTIFPPPLDISILNTLATRGIAQTFGEGLGRSTVAHFARKVRGANIVAAKHELKTQQSHALKRWLYSLRVRGPHFASKVSYNAGAATDDDAGLRKSPLRGRCCQYLIFYLEHPPYKGYR